jgi:hypothetical protein
VQENQQNPTVSQKHQPARRKSGRTHRAKPASATAQHPGPAKAEASAQASAGARTEQVGVLGLLPYLLVLAGVGAGLFVAFQGSKYTARGAALAGAALLAAALARLVLPPRYAGLLMSRNKGLDVLAFALLGGGVLGLALWLP